MRGHTGTTFQVVYHLWSDVTPDWLRVIADGIPHDEPRVPSLTFLWKGAEWMEREAYDMFGLVFEGNRDLRRIYLPGRLRELPAAQGLPPGRRRRALAGRRRPADGARRGARDADETTLRRTTPGARRRARDDDPDAGPASTIPR